MRSTTQVEEPAVATKNCTASTVQELTSHVGEVSTCRRIALEAAVYTLEEPLLLTRDIELVAPRQATIVGSKFPVALTVIPGMAVTLRNITFTSNTTAFGTAGSLSNQGHLELDSCRFVGLGVGGGETLQGGAIVNDGELVARHCQFERNIATDGVRATRPALSHPRIPDPHCAQAHAHVSSSSLGRGRSTTAAPTHASRIAPLWPIRTWAGAGRSTSPSAVPSSAPDVCL